MTEVDRIKNLISTLKLTIEQLESRIKYLELGIDSLTKDYYAIEAIQNELTRHQ